MVHRRRRQFLLGSAALVLASFAPAPALTRSLQSREADTPDGDAARLSALARDVDRVESVRAIKRLQLAWAHHVDMGEWERAAALFTDDAELVHADDRFTGRAAIRAHFREAIGKGTGGLPPHHVHLPLMMAPIVILAPNGESANARWHAFSMRGALGDDAGWEGGIFENAYVRQHGVWKIRRQVFQPQLSGPYADGWSPFRRELPLVPYHFGPEDVIRPLVQGLSAPAPTGASAALPALAGRIRALRDEVEVRNLQNAYGYYVDFRMWDHVVDLFDPAGSLSIAGVGSWRGQEGVRRFLEADGPAGLRYGELHDHIQANVVVEVDPDGMRARARGVELGMVGRNEGKAWWLLTRFDNLFVKRGGVWRFDRIRKAPWLKTDYALGWARHWADPEPPPPGSAPDGDGEALPPLWPLERRAPQPHPSAGTTLAEAERQLHAAAADDSAENLAGAYGQYIDDNQWEDLAALFAAQGERDSAGGGFIRTPARIASFSRARYGPYDPGRAVLNMHMRTQPVIHVAADGRSAQMRTRLFQTVIAPPTSGAAPRSWARGPMFITGMYEDDLVFEDGAWRFKRVDIDHLLYAPYKTGWTGIPEGYGKAMTPSLGSMAGVAFDAPGAGDTYPAFPRVPHMWFHYRNPVSGRSPSYLMPKYPLPEP